MQVEFIHGDLERPDFSAMFGQMFGGWLTEYEGHTFMVDCGVGTGAKTLVKRLENRLNGRNLDYVLLTHIHMDHAGGLGEILKKWPDVKIVAHAKGVRHLIRPEQLWLGTQEVMGEYAAMYGRPDPADPAALLAHTEARIPGLTIFETPGHAPHHLSYRLGPTMFVGEASGCPFLLKGRLYNRPASPPRFFRDADLASIDLLLRERPETAYFGHTHQPLPYRECLHLCRDQIYFWDEYLRRPEAAIREGETADEHLDRLTDGLLDEDLNPKPLSLLPPMEFKCERYFMRNAVEGFLRDLPQTRALKRAGQ